jgi:amidase
MLRRLSRTELQRYARKARFRIDDAEVDEYLILSEAMFDALDQFNAVATSAVINTPALREPGRRPTPQEDPFNAIIRWCRVKSECEGLLSGKRVGLKDIFAVAGIPKTLGSKVLQGYVPETDSVLVERLLAAGAEIVAICNMDSFAASIAGDTGFYGPIVNPIAPGRSAGGSSGGSAAALYLPNIDLTYGADQGGSIRIPAAWCGVLGLKPTFGLIPYTGAAGIDATIDHAGPLARNTSDLALALQVVAGAHESDPRQVNIRVENYIEAVGRAPEALTGLRLGVVSEAFRTDLGIEPETAEATLEAVNRLRELGAEVAEVSVPEHLVGNSLGFTIFPEGATALFNGFGNGYHWRGRYAPDFAIAFGKGVRSLGQDMPPAYKISLVVGTYLREHYFSQFYAKAQNMRLALRSGYDRALSQVDLLVMPTATSRPIELTSNPTLSEKVLRGWKGISNTFPQNLTGHPALSVPAAECEGLPVGLMIVGRMFEEGKLLSVAHTYERRYGWFPKSMRGVAQ